MILFLRSQTQKSNLFYFIYFFI